MNGLRKWVSELMVYDPNDTKSRWEASEFVEDNSVGAWTVASEPVEGVTDFGRALRGYCHLSQLTISSHGFPGGAWFSKGGHLTTETLRQVSVPPDLYEKEGRLLFLGCETARTPVGRKFLIAAGQHFFGGKGGVVGGATIQTLGYPSGTVLGIMGWTNESHLPKNIGRLVVLKLDGGGDVVAERIVGPLA
jgi:hypothetical protein